MGRLRELLADGPVVLDGGLATALEAAGHDLSDALWSARVLIEDPAAVEAAHAAYVRAGAQVVISASYQVSFEALGDAAERVLGESVRVARRAVGAAGVGGAGGVAGAAGAAGPRGASGAGALVAASVGPYGAILAGGQEYTGDYGDVDLEAFHTRRLRALLAAAPDCVACETLPRADEAAAIVRALERLGAPDAWVSFACRDGGHTAHGEPIEAAVAAVASSPAVVAVGVNCTAPEHVTGLLRRMRAVTDLPLVAYPNAGRSWDAGARAWSGAAATTLPPALVREWIDAGARLVGGCCGFGPPAIAALAASGYV
jgi:homocysteine S-methyltransferase